MREILNKTNLRRVILMFLALFITGFAVALYERAGYGTDPFTCMNMAIAARIGLPFGTWQIILNLVLLVFVFFFGRNLIGIATVANMILIGKTVDFIDSFVPVVIPQSLPARLALMFAGILIVSFGTALYTRSGLGISPYDAIWFILTHKTHWNYRLVKILLDCTTTSIGFAFGGVVGIATVILAFFMGPLVGWLNVHICGPLLHAEEYEEEPLMN